MTQRELEKPGGYPSQLWRKSLVKVPWKQMWFDLIASGTLHENMVQQPKAVLLSPWQALQSEHQFSSAPPAPAIPATLPTPPVASGVQSYWMLPPMPWVEDAGSCSLLMMRIDGNWRPHVELTSHWSPRNKWKLTALVDAGREFMVSLRSFLAPLVPSVVTEGTQSP